MLELLTIENKEIKEKEIQELESNELVNLLMRMKIYSPGIEDANTINIKEELKRRRQND